jgi:hypothetical protein
MYPFVSIAGIHFPFPSNLGIYRAPFSATSDAVGNLGDVNGVSVDTEDYDARSGSNSDDASNSSGSE